MGHRVSNVKRALELLDKSQGVQVKHVSSLYETEPVGIEDQPWFVNAVAKLKTSLKPQKLYGLCKEIEKRMGRIESLKWGPRIIDVDILLFNQKIIETKNLTIPHPQLHKRAFVLVPLAELNSDIVHPKFDRSIAEMLHDLGKNKKKVVKLKEKKSF